MRATTKKQGRSKSDSRRSRRAGSSRTSAAGKRARPERRDQEAPHIASPTAVAAEALRTGVQPKGPRQRRDDNTREAEKMRVGDPDDNALRNEYSGEDTPGGSTPTPDQNSVDEIGTAYGLQDEDSGALRSAHEVLTRRDKRRTELTAPRRPQP
jgi:hypothetical protein